MNAIRIEKIPSGMNLRGIVKYKSIGFGLFVYSLMLTNLLKVRARKFVESANPYTTERAKQCMDI